MDGEGNDHVPFVALKVSSALAVIDAPALAHSCARAMYVSVFSCVLQLEEAMHEFAASTALPLLQRSVGDVTPEFMMVDWQDERQDGRALHGPAPKPPAPLGGPPKPPCPPPGGP